MNLQRRQLNDGAFEAGDEFGLDVARFDEGLADVIERADVREFRENWDSPQSVPGDLVSA